MDQERWRCQINEICSAPSSIGETYKDQIVCDVLNMDVCHILLGRPWQYDIQAIHKGRENTYESQWMNKKIVSMPLRKKNEEGVNQKKAESHFFITVSGMKFLQNRESDILLQTLIVQKFLA